MTLDEVLDLPDEDLEEWRLAIFQEVHRRQVLRDAESRAAEVQDQVERELGTIAAEFLRARDGNPDPDDPSEWVQPTGEHNAYPKDWPVFHKGKRWRSLRENNAHEPGVSGWREMTDGIADWVQPSGADDAYDVGEEVMHNGKHWISTRENNVWEPGTFDAGWDEVTEDADPDPEPDPEPERPEGYVGPWDKDATYNIGDVVDRNGKYYRAKVKHGAEYQGTWGPPIDSVWDDLGAV